MQSKTSESSILVCKNGTGHEQEIVRDSKGYLNFNCFEMNNFPLQGFLVAEMLPLV